MEILDVLSLAVLAFVGFRLADAARHTIKDRGYVWLMVAGLRPRHFVLAVPVLAIVLCVALALFQIPGLSFGWWTAIGGEGNPAFGAAPEGSAGPLESVIPVAFGAMLILALPLLVEGEELLFRRGAETRTPAANLRRAFLFGLVHALVGIPIGAALALTISGWYFTAWYLREWHATGSRAAALIASTRAHLAYNLVVVGIVVLSLTLA
ncbi:MAG: hypothetical protein ACRDY7_12425 [Acidimicrobiia bacterium]